MSLEAILDTVVHLANFKTFDMLAQGTYRLRMQAYIINREGVKVNGVPFMMPENKFSSKKIVQNLYESGVDIKLNSAHTSSFFIRYCDQECHVNQIAIFRFGLDGFPKVPKEFFLEVDLLGLETGEEKNLKNDKHVVVDPDGFVQLTRSVVKVKHTLTGLHEYAPIIFSDYLFSYVDCFVHTSIMNLIHKSKPSQVGNPIPPPKTPQEAFRNKVRATTCLHDFVKLYCIGQPANFVDEFFNAYPKFMLNQLRDTILYLEQTINKLEITRETNITFLEGLGTMKEQMQSAPADFPDFVYRVSLDKDSMTAEQYHEKNFFQMIIDGCKYLSPKMKEGLIKSMFVTVNFILKDVNNNVEEAVEAVVQFITRMSGLVQLYFFKLLDLSYLAVKPMLLEGRARYHKLVRDKIKRQCVFLNDYIIDDLGYSGEQNIGELHNRLANNHRDNLVLTSAKGSHDELSLENLTIFPPVAETPIVFIESYLHDSVTHSTEPKIASTSHKKPKNYELSTTMRATMMPDNFKENYHNEFLRPSSKTDVQNMHTLKDTSPGGRTELSGETTEAVVPEMIVARNDSPMIVSKRKPRRDSVSSLEDETVMSHTLKAKRVDSLSDLESPEKDNTEGFNMKHSENIKKQYQDQPLIDEMIGLELGLADNVPALEEQQDKKLNLSLPPSGFASSKGARQNFPSASNIESEEDVHLVIFVHGYEGCSFDMKLLKNLFCFLAKPNIICHSATANETDSTADIFGQGSLLAAEIIELVKFNFKPGELKKISFIAHSLGGLVVRAALPHLKQYRAFMHTFMTFGTPHLGCANGTSMLVKTGMSFFTKIMGHKSLNQMNMTDTPDPKDSFIMKLSSVEGLEWFEHFVVFASYQDLYVPFISARIEYGNIDQTDKKRSHLFKRMVQNLLGRLKHKSLVRVDINLKQTKTLNSFIGRSAHIRVLDSIELQTIIAYFFVEYLD